LFIQNRLNGKGLWVFSQEGIMLGRDKRLLIVKSQNWSTTLAYYFLLYAY